MADWKSIVGSVAPALATALGGPLAGAATKTIAAAVVGTDKADDDTIKQAVLGATPEQLAALKEADHDFAVKMKELGVDLERIAKEDRESARTMQAATKSLVVPVLATLTVIGFFVMLGYMLAGRVSMDNTILGIVIGAVSSKAEQVYNFYFGSSAGSKQKTEALAKGMDSRS